MERLEAHGRAAPSSLQEIRSLVLIDTTQMALERSISGAAQRHEALAANLANASTPGYRRVDVDFHGALAAALGTGD
jgi:flagellar basal-body rod protein FlgB